MAAHEQYLLHLADNALILGQRNAEWCGHGPVLEEDLALANNSLDLIGQARLLYQRVAALRNDGKTSEDLLAYFRNEPEFRNYTLAEIAHSTALTPTTAGDRDYAVTITRNFLFSALMVLVWNALKSSTDQELAAIAAKSLKEAQYHLRHSRDWLVKFGDGTEVSHARVQAALDHLMPYTQEFWPPSPMEAAAVRTAAVSMSFAGAVAVGATHVSSHPPVPAQIAASEQAVGTSGTSGTPVSQLATEGSVGNAASGSSGTAASSTTTTTSTASTSSPGTSSSPASLEKTLRTFRAKFFQRANDAAFGHSKRFDDLHQTTGS